jgi:hypothetical protein
LAVDLANKIAAWYPTHGQLFFGVTAIRFTAWWILHSCHDAPGRVG